jgi:hypothetical protein
MVIPGLLGGQLGDYFEKKMQPYIEEKLKEGVISGQLAMASGKALKEISHPNSLITKIFGPTGYEQGAEFYAGQTAASTYSAAHYADMDNLSKMDPADIPKHLSQTMDEVMTGDPLADSVARSAIVEANGPLMNTIVKTRVARQQTDAIANGHAALASAATSLQAMVSQQTRLGGTDPDAEGQSAIQTAVRTFSGLLGQPKGMTDDSYRRLLYGTARDAMQSGNGYAVAVMHKAGVYDLLSPDEQDKLDENYIRFGKRANADATANYTEALIAHDAKVALGQLTPMQAAADLNAINLKIKRSTGFEVDVFDASDIRADAHTVTSAVIAADNKREERTYQRYLRQQDWDHDAAVQREKEARTVAAAQITWRAGSPVQAIAGGVDKELIEAQASNDWFKGDNSAIVRNFQQGYISPAVKAAAQSNVQASVGEQYNKDFEQAHQRWAKLYAAKPAAALAYYGEYHVMMQRFDSLTKQGTDPVTAFSKTFGDASQYGSADIDPSRRKEVADAMDGVVSSQTWQAQWNLAGRSNLGALGNNVVMRVAKRHVEIAGNNSPVSTAQLMSEAVGAATASGEFERYGQFAWTNKAGTQPIGQMLGLRDRDADAVFANVYNRHAVAQGAVAGTDPDSILRYDNNGHPAVVAVLKNRKGQPIRMALTYEELAAEAHTYVSSKVARPSNGNGVDPTMRPGGMK